MHFEREDTSRGGSEKRSTIGVLFSGRIPIQKKKKKNETRKTQYQKVLPFVKVEVVVCMRLIKAKLSLLFCKVCV